MSSALVIYLKVQPPSFRRFPSHAVPLDASKGKKCKALKVLKKEISEKKLDGEKMYFVSLPLESTHTHRLIGTTRRMHSSVRTKIHELVQDGVANVKKQVEKMSASDIVKPHPSDRAYFPTTRDIYNCIHALLVAGKYSQLDQLQLEMLVKEWMARDTDKPLSDRTKFFFRKSSTESNLRCVLVTCQIKGDVGVSITPKEKVSMLIVMKKNREKMIVMLIQSLIKDVH